MPNTMSDVDGAYGGMDGKVHHAKGWTKYGTISGWDVYRSQIPLVAMLRPGVASDVVRSLAADARQSGHLPKWPTLQGQNDVMVGDPADLIIAGAHAFGARSFHARAALRAMVAGATKGGISPNAGYVERPGLADYLRHGYVGYERNAPVIAATVDPTRVWGTAATTLEYGSADFGIARLAAAIGDKRTCRAFLPRAGAWRRLLDPRTQRIRPRYARSGAFASDDEWDSSQGFVEGSESQYQWAVPHDVAGLVAATGGRAAAVKRLRTFFTRLNTGTESPYAFLGNEPNLHVPYLFDWVGRPDLGAAVARRALRTLYRLTPGGYPGNDDGGQMASWWVLNALGLYPAVPGEGVLAFGAPLFPHAALTLRRGTLRIDATGTGATRTRVRAVRVNGRRHARTWLAWRDVARGARIRVALGKGGRWGRAKAAAPPSFGAHGSCAPLRSSLSR
jgi:predicted alpha-1,2-mannosidase